MSFAGFLGGLSEGIYEGIEKEEERINLLADKAYDQFTQDLRTDKAKREAARKAAEGYMFRLKDAGFDLSTSAHIARYGEDAVKAAETKAATYGDTYDLNTLYNVAPDPSTQDFKQGQWLDLIVGESTVKASDYMGKYGGAADYKTMFGPSARDVFNDRIKGLNVAEAIPTGKFGTESPMRLTSKEMKTHNSFEATLVNLTQQITSETDPNKKAILQSNFNSTMSSYVEFKNAKEDEGKVGPDFSKQSRRSIVESYISSALPDIAQSIDGRLQIAFEGNEIGYMTGMNQALVNLENDFEDINDDMMNNSIASARNNFAIVKRGYVNKEIEKFNSTDKKDTSKFIPTAVDGTIPTKKAIEDGVANRQYETGSVIIYKDIKGITQIAIWTGTSLIGASSSYNIN